MRSFLYLFLAVIFLTTFVSAQPAKISPSEYFSQFDIAKGKTEAVFPRKVDRKREEYEAVNTKKSTNETYEYAAVDRIRHLVEITTILNGKHRSRHTTTDQYIQIGDKCFFREGKANWKKSGPPCDAIMYTAGPSKIETEEYSVEDVITNGHLRVFRRYITWTYGGIKWALERRFTVDSRGLLVKVEENNIKVEPKESYLTEVETYEYNVSVPVIKAPIK